LDDREALAIRVYSPGSKSGKEKIPSAFVFVVSSGLPDTLIFAPETGELLLELSRVTLPWIAPNKTGVLLGGTGVLRSGSGVLLGGSGVLLGRLLETVDTGWVLGGKGVRVSGNEAGVLLGLGIIVTRVGTCVVEPQAMSTKDRITGTNTLDDKLVTGVGIFIRVSISQPQL
jgi:hypothetical protein